MTTIQSSTCGHHWVCAIATLTINAEGDEANFLLTVIASIPRIRIKKIVLAPVEIT